MTTETFGGLPAVPVWLTLRSERTSLDGVLGWLMSCMLDGADRGLDDGLVYRAGVLEPAACHGVAEALMASKDEGHQEEGRAWLWLAACLDLPEAVNRLLAVLHQAWHDGALDLGQDEFQRLVDGWTWRSLLVGRNEKIAAARLGQAQIEAGHAAVGRHQQRDLDDIGDLNDEFGIPWHADTMSADQDEESVVVQGRRGEPALKTPMPPFVRKPTAPAAASRRVVVPASSTAPTLRVLDAIGDSTSPTSDGGKLRQRFGGLLSPLPLKGGGVDPAVFTRRMMATHPWLEGAIKHVAKYIRLAKAEGRDFFTMPPLLLLGKPGCGKSDILPAMADELGLGCRTMGMAGMADDKPISGMARGWAGATPGAVPMACAEFGVANPMFVWDELEKAAAIGKQNGSPLDALLPLLEPGTASRLHDICLQGEVNGSMAIHVATANSLIGVPAPILDRFLTVRCPSPGPEHLEHILGNMRLRDAKRLGIHPALLPAMEPIEVEWLRGILKERRSLRPLRKAYDALLAAKLDQEPAADPAPLLN